jgi:hypothetical protein
MKDPRRAGSRTDWRTDAADAGSPRHDQGSIHPADAAARHGEGPIQGVEPSSRPDRSAMKDGRFAGTRMRADAGVSSSSTAGPARERPVDVICAGMYRACSTWQYEVAAHLIEQHSDQARLGYLTGEQFAERSRSEPSNSQQPARTSWKVLKSHEGHECFANALADGTALALYAYRDVRDVVFSLMHKRKLTFEKLLRQGMVHQILANDRFWMRQPGLLVQRYEQILANPVQAVIEIANHLGFGVNQSDAEQIAQEYSLESNLARTQALKEQLEQAGINLDDQANAQICDSASLLHWNHLRKGGSGSWADEATPQQIIVLERLYGPWLEEHGYSHGTTDKPHRLSIVDRLKIETNIQRGYAAWLIRTVALKFPRTVSTIKSILGMHPKKPVGAKVWNEPRP